jgi:hypothetical protein
VQQIRCTSFKVPKRISVERLQDTWSNIAVGMASVATALGASTIPDILPSHGQHDSKR